MKNNKVRTSIKISYKYKKSTSPMPFNRREINAKGDLPNLFINILTLSLIC